MKKITPHLWFDKEAKEAAEFYATVFDNAKVTHVSQIHDTPSGDCDIVSFEIGEQSFMAISAGPVFKLNPSISFFVNFDPSKDPQAREKLDKAWEKLAEGGKVLMELTEYPFSKHYGWVQDKYGVSWQLMLTNPEGEERPFILPSMMFTQEVFGKADEAIDFYCSIFKESKRGTTAKYPEEMGPDTAGKITYADFNLMNSWFAAMDGPGEHEFKFNEAISLLIPCDTQEEIDYYWDKLSADPEAGQCGWLKDKFGVSWQVWPTRMGEMMEEGTDEQGARVTRAFMQMKKFDLATLEKAFKGE